LGIKNIIPFRLRCHILVYYNKYISLAALTFTDGLNIYSHSTAGVSVSNEFGEIVAVVSPHPARVQTGRNKKKSENRRDVMCRRLKLLFFFSFFLYMHTAHPSLLLSAFCWFRVETTREMLWEKRRGGGRVQSFVCEPPAII
jgi:hypothetical protein